METSSMLARATESELLDKLQSSIVKERVLMFLITEVGACTGLHAAYCNDRGTFRPS
jgi:hypothetical protein